MVQGISFDGLASGLATDEIIRGLMEIERAPIRRMERQKEGHQEIRDAWRDVNMRLSSLEKTLTPLRLSSTYDSFSTSSSDDKVATASATSDVDAGNYHLDITTIARAHRVASDAQQDPTAGLDLRGEIKINGVEIAIREGDSLVSIRDKINGSYGIGVQASLISNTLVLESQRTGIENEIQVEDDRDVLVSLGILSGGELDNLAQTTSNEVEVSSAIWDAENVVSGNRDDVWTSEESPPQWVDLIFYDGAEEPKERWPVRFNRLELFTPTEGEVGSIKDFDLYAWDYVNQEGNLIASVRDNTQDHVSLDFDSLETEHLRINILETHDGDVATVEEVEIYNRSQGFKNTLVEADDARLTINGVAVQSESNSIDDAVQGMSFTLNTVGESTITVIQNLEPTMEAMRGFVEQYNSTMDFIADKLDYDPDTEQAGALQGDSTLMRLGYSIRQELMGMVSLGDAHSYSQLMEIGVEIDRYGMMTLNESKFQAALQQNPDDVKMLLTAEDYETAEGDIVTGAAVRLNQQLQSYLRRGGIIHNRDQMYYTMMGRIDTQIDNLERRMEMREQNLRRQFVRLERVMSDFMSQSQWLEGQIANLAGFSNNR